MSSDTVYEQHARHMVKTLGHERARAETIRSRDQNVMGSFSHAFHNAVLKQIDRLARESA